MFTRPDNGVYPSAALSSDIDLAELAARLTFNRLRRNGRVVFYDDFGDAGQAWAMGAIGLSGFYTYFNTVQPYTPPGMAVLVGTAGNTASMSTILPAISSKSLGLEITYRLDDRYLPGMVDYFTIMVDTSFMQAGIRLNTSVTKLEVYSSAGTWGTPSWLPIVTKDVNIWHNLKVVIDCENQSYRQIFFNRSYGFGNTSAYATGSAGLTLTLSSLDAAIGNAGVIIDNVIITTDEKL